MFRPFLRCVLFGLTSISGVASAATTLTFEGLNDGDILGTLGSVTFASAVVATAGVTLNEFEVPPRSGANVALNETATLTVTFAGGVHALSGFITYAAPLNISASGLLGAVGSYTTLFDSNLALSGDPFSSPNESFSFASSSLITTLVFTANSPISFALDDLTFDRFDTVPVPVPEPESWTLLLMGVVYLISRRKNRSLKTSRQGK